MSDLIPFIGRFHPLILHLPIGMLVGVAVLEWMSWFKREVGSFALTFLLSLATISSICAAATGLLLSWSETYNAESIFWHQWLGIGVALTSLLALVLRVRALKDEGNRGLGPYRYALTLCMILLMFAGHGGGSITHGSNYLFEAMPESLARWFGQTKDSEIKSSGDFFSEHIQPILETKCLPCHNDEKQKGDYLMTTKDKAFAGGESELEAIVPGLPMKSHLVELILLPEEDDDVMPPEGKTRLTDRETLELVRWIYEGASWPETVVLKSKKSSKKEKEGKKPDKT